ncbi:ABC transporter ATP-binding protein [Natronosporangium hydrolyticum]|uniref:ABC transporter ATP-binding protein n=1 Tax=Natronosporangium hydrolyticum TaxID=2811111 RepID=A0A895Y6H3_9ACTN|nr:ABC transporter ATP-binding protein [Natronosporangium hydrolyticum]QSB13334.1 ABC transporter ATP-binding protein [Natronosporangium hydrolyticum]
MAMIEVHHLRKTFGSTVAVADVSFSVEEGEILGVLGPNGAGKTTTVECITAAEPYNAGQIRILGRAPREHGRRLFGLVGYQLQTLALPRTLRVHEAVTMFASFYPEPRDGGELLEVVGLTRQRKTAFGKLSGGQKQRLSIALALVGNPRVAVLDELTTGLDPEGRRDTWGLIREIRDSGVTIVLVTHFLDEAHKLADRVTIIDHGHTVATAAPAELIAATGADNLEEAYLHTLDRHRAAVKGEEPSAR